jgi:hypothetical protein
MRWWPRRAKSKSIDDHRRAMTDLKVKDGEIDRLMARADGLVGELQVTVRHAADARRRASGDARE